MKKLLLLLLCAGALVAQTPEVSISQAPGPNPYQVVYGYNAGNLIFACYARTTQPQVSAAIAISAATNANPVVFTSTAHGFNTNSRPSITISGGTGNWVAVNGTFTATVIDANTFSIAVDSSAFGAVAGTLTFTTSAARTNQQQWAVKLFAYDGSGNQVWAGWLNGNSAFRNRCSDATLTTTNIQ